MSDAHELLDEARAWVMWAVAQENLRGTQGLAHGRDLAGRLRAHCAAAAVDEESAAGLGEAGEPNAAPAAREAAEAAVALPVAAALLGLTPQHLAHKLANEHHPGQHDATVTPDQLPLRLVIELARRQAHTQDRLTELQRLSVELADEDAPDGSER